MKNSSRLLSIIDPIIRTWGSLSIGTRGQFKMGTRGSVCSGISSYKAESWNRRRRNALVILSQKWTFCHLPCRFVHFSGIGPGFAIPLCGSDKELRE